jgi:hypothetical protein
MFGEKWHHCGMALRLAQVGWRQRRAQPPPPMQAALCRRQGPLLVGAAEGPPQSMRRHLSAAGGCRGAAATCVSARPRAGWPGSGGGGVQPLPGGHCAPDDRRAAAGAGLDLCQHPAARRRPARWAAPPAPPPPLLHCSRRLT